MTRFLQSAGVNYKTNKMTIEGSYGDKIANG